MIDTMNGFVERRHGIELHSETKEAKEPGAVSWDRSGTVRQRRDTQSEADPCDVSDGMDKVCCRKRPNLCVNTE